MKFHHGYLHWASLKCFCGGYQATSRRSSYTNPARGRQKSGFDMSILFRVNNTSVYETYVYEINFWYEHTI